MKYQPEVDGLRALAVTLVVLFHTNMPLFEGGFIGVDIFFVITGYLMTRLICQCLSEDNFVILNFYFKRIRRIVPSMLIMILIFTPLSFLLLTPMDFENFSESLIASTAFLANIYYYRNGNYFDVNLANYPLLHLWSISLEAQYYVIFPAILLIINKITRKVIFKAITMVMFIIISLVVLQFDLISDKSAFFLLTGRFWEFAIGSLAAFYVARKNSEINNSSIYCLVGLALIIVPIFTTNNSKWPDLLTLAPTVGSALIIIFANSKNFTGKLLGSKVLSGLGKLSYSLFLFHYPIFVLARVYSKSNLAALEYFFLTILSLIMAYFSFKYIENPFRKSTIVSAKTFFIYTISCVLAVLILGTVGKITSGFKKFYLDNRLTNSQKNAFAVFDLHAGKDITKRTFDDLDCKFATNDLDNEAIKRFNACYIKYGKALVVIGDSHSLNLYNIIARSNNAFVFSLAKAGCRPSEELRDCNYVEIKDFIYSVSNKIDKVIYHQSGSYLLSDNFGGNDLRNVIDSYPEINYDYDNYRKTVRYLSSIGLFSDVIWIGFRPEPNIDLTNPVNFSLDLRIPRVNLILFNALNQKVNIKYLNFKFIPFDKFVDLPIDFMVNNECLMWNDEDHFSECGEIFLADKILYRLN